MSLYERARVAFEVARRDEMQRIAFLIEAYFSDYLHSPSDRNFVGSTTGKKRALKNNTSQLYTMTGKLRRALKPKQPGNIFKMESSGAVLTLTIGIDLAAVPYARIHEYGGKTGKGGRVTLRPRPYLTPGVKAFFEEEMRGVVERIMTKTASAI